MEISSGSFDSQLEALGHVHRRRLLLALLEASAEDELPVEFDQMGYDTAETSFQISLHHVHLPKLDDSGFIDATIDGKSVTTGPRFSEIKPLLEILGANREQLPDDWV